MSRRRKRPAKKPKVKPDYALQHRKEEAKIDERVPWWERPITQPSRRKGQVDG